jgi:hypothetical protein
MSKRKKNKKKVRINFRDVDQLLENPVPLKPISFSIKIRCKQCGLPGFLSIKAEGDGVVDIYIECPFCQNEEQIYTVEEMDYGDYEEECSDGEEEIIEDFLKRDEPLTEEEEQKEITERGYVTQDPRKV